MDPFRADLWDEAVYVYLPPGQSCRCAGPVAPNNHCVFSQSWIEGSIFPLSVWHRTVVSLARWTACRRIIQHRTTPVPANPCREVLGPRFERLHPHGALVTEASFFPPAFLPFPVHSYLDV